MYELGKKLHDANLNEEESAERGLEEKNSNGQEEGKSSYTNAKGSGSLLPKDMIVVTVKATLKVCWH